MVRSGIQARCVRSITLRRDYSTHGKPLLWMDTQDDINGALDDMPRRA